ncbi:hypothetical protein F4778DRAFT_777976 [Xylariomycetidae sp. FL2044]|nr:hypothetical protein F4778DRAFT_777976 [Xylariomycetidae sp. FL2044]
MYTKTAPLCLFGSLLAVVPALSAPAVEVEVDAMKERAVAPRGTEYFKLCTGKNYVDCYDAPNQNAHCTNVPDGMNDRINSVKATGPNDVCYLYLVTVGSTRFAGDGRRTRDCPWAYLEIFLVCIIRDHDCQGGYRGGPVTNDDAHADLSKFGPTWVNSISSYVCV